MLYGFRLHFAFFLEITYIPHFNTNFCNIVAIKSLLPCYLICSASLNTHFLFLQNERGDVSPSPVGPAIVNVV